MLISVRWWKTGNFRQDLLYRINTIEIHIPPLRERGNDIILLAEHFLDRYARKYKKKMHGLTREAKNKLLKYAWPGNVEGTSTYDRTCRNLWRRLHAET